MTEATSAAPAASTHLSESSILLNPHDRPLALLTLAGLRAIEADAMAVLPPHTLMARAGHAAASFLRERIAQDKAQDDAQNHAATARTQVWIAAGPGNNGGDALVLATDRPTLFAGSLKTARITWRRATPNL